MLDKRSLHAKVQEQADCFADTDLLGEMAGLVREKDSEEGALKWLALAILHGIDRNAEKISLRVDEKGAISVTAKYRKSELPRPPSSIGRKVFDVVRDITHIEENKGRMPVVIGIRDSSIELEMKLDRDGSGEEVVLTFPE
ncbi:MAG: hypothetical protein M0Z81_04235 [Deltaproteobacteria bacterium]|jgi:hypothetical protein|nr:hypothetical protein [Deltaproteobacteria bacterium]